LTVSETASRKAEDTMLHHDFSRAVIRDRVARFQEEADADRAERDSEGREEPAERHEKSGTVSGFLRLARSLPLIRR
jgi:hypothetical protein